jgi:sec-independent protein translocase protein TatA
MFGNLGMGEMMVALVIVLILFGAKRIPEISASLGQGIREFKRNMADIESPPPGVAPRARIDAPRPDQQPPSTAAEERPEPKRLL